jgi:16S rRNA (uracil1498-N3)-methyltransferase
MFCDEAGDAPPVLAALAGREAGAWAALIGPEGGFSPSERMLIRGHPAAVAVSLGPRILRADTAAISALTLWQAALGDLGGP